MVVDVEFRGMMGLFLEQHDPFVMEFALCVLHNVNLEYVIIALMGENDWSDLRLERQQDLLKGSILTCHLIRVIESGTSEAEQRDWIGIFIGKTGSLFIEPTSTP